MMHSYNASVAVKTVMVCIKTNVFYVQTWTMWSTDCTHRSDNVPVIDGYRTVGSSFGDFLPRFTSALTGKHFSPDVAASSAVSCCSECSHIARVVVLLLKTSHSQADNSQVSSLSSSWVSFSVSSPISLDCHTTTTIAHAKLNTNKHFHIYKFHAKKTISPVTVHLYKCSAHKNQL